MKECDILGAVKTYSDPSYIFSGVKTPNPRDLLPCMLTLKSDLESRTSQLVVYYHMLFKVLLDKCNTKNYRKVIYLLTLFARLVTNFTSASQLENFRR